MADEKAAIAIASRDRERDLQLLIPVAGSPNDVAASCKPSSSSSSSQQTGREVFFTSFQFILLPPDRWKLVSGVACCYLEISVCRSRF